MLSKQSVVVLAEGTVDAEVDGEIVALRPDTGACYGLNEVGSRVWQSLAEPIQVDNLCQRLVAEYRVAPEQCEAEVLHLLGEMLENRLIEVR